ncbi:unnamed protein product [Phyllotreta striolata]|uniref:5'-nucleotidase n=1 Tax=Phyllotreta striolata TaxID=444603 RepID=A0A9N9XJK5_PHYSR|nr:unnamed protein product [Phyllotreta striolata]
MKNYVCQVPEFAKANVFVNNPELVNEKLANLIQGGFHKLQVVSDFDKTITKQHQNGKIHISSFGMFSSCPSVTEEHTRIANEINKKYAPCEVDPTIPKSEKRRLMEEWWSQSEDSLRGLCVSREEIEEVCARIGPELRDGTKELFEELHKADVPVLVFSAGLGDTVQAVLKHFNVNLPNVEVISNFLKYDNEGRITGFKNSTIHVYNKNEVALKGTDFYKRIEDRENAILMGDSLGDAAMVDGVETVKNVLKIGFLYERSKEALPEYMNTFDIVLVDDQTMNLPKAILGLIKNSFNNLGNGKA